MSSKTRLKWLRELNDREDYPFKFMEGDTIYCKTCECSFSASQKSQLKQHKESIKHKTNIQKKTKRTQVQAQLETLAVTKPKVSRSDILGKQLCEAFLSANIPWYKLQAPKLRSFMEDNLGIKIPDECMLRTKYLDQCTDDVLKEIEKELRGHPIWISVDETTDAVGRYVVNVLAGRLDSDEYHPPHLINSSFLERTNSDAIARLVNDSLKALWPNFDEELLKLLLSDAAPYMIKAGKSLKVFFPSLVSLTCFAHGLHRVCETARQFFEDVNSLIAWTKKVFLKAPSRISAWRDSYPNLPLPPNPIVTR
jgi:hypothetical protein